MNEDQEKKLQSLLRLKRHESTPSPDFVERFLEDFQYRQRAELLKQSSIALFFERAGTYFSDLFAPKWAMAGAAVVVVGIVAWFALPSGGANQTAAGSDKAQKKQEPFLVESVRIMTIELQSDIDKIQLVKEMEKVHGGQIVIVPTGDATGIAVPAGVFIEAYAQQHAAGK